jgi:hypothetical protein
MDQQELEKLKAVLPETLMLQEHGPDAPCIYDRELEDVYPIGEEPDARAALKYVMSCYAAAGRKRATAEQQKQLRDLLGLTHSLNDIHTRIGALNTRLIEVEENYVRVKRHQWDAAGERCVHCGDKDWMGGECAGTDTPNGIGETPDAAAPSASRSRSSGGTGSQKPRPEEAPATESN